MILRLQNSSDALVVGGVDREDWIRAAIILLGGFLIAVVISRLLQRVIARGVGESFAAVIAGRLTSYAVFLLGLFYALTALGVQVGPLLGALGIGGLVVAFSLQGVAQSFVSSFIIQARRPYTIGESVEICGHVGTVLDIDARTTLLKSVDGSQIRIPNANVASTTIINLTREPVRRGSLDIGVAYDTDLRLAREALLRAAGRVPRILTDPPPVVSATEFDDSSIGLRILYWHQSDIPTALAARTDLIFAVHEALLAETITIAFPQMVVWGGIESDSSIYLTEPGTVDLPFPGLGQQSVRKRRIAPSLRRLRDIGDAGN